MGFINEDHHLFDYELTGILIHSGSANAGHYFSYIKETDQGNKNYGKWFEFNDTHVTNFDPKRIKAECFGGDMDSKQRTRVGPCPAGHASQRSEGRSILVGMKSKHIIELRLALASRATINPSSST